MIGRTSAIWRRARSHMQPRRSRRYPHCADPRRQPFAARVRAGRALKSQARLTGPPVPGRAASTPSRRMSTLLSRCWSARSNSIALSWSAIGGGVARPSRPFGRTGCASSSWSILPAICPSGGRARWPTRFVQLALIGEIASYSLLWPRPDRLGSVTAPSQARSTVAWIKAPWLHCNRIGRTG